MTLWIQCCYYWRIYSLKKSGTKWLLFSPIYASRVTVKKREKTYGGKADDQIASSYITYVQNKFPAAKNTDLKYHVIDAMYENNNKEETKYFETESNKLFGFIRTRPSISTQEVKRIMTENEKLRQEIENKTMRWWRACANRFFYTS